MSKLIVLPDNVTKYGQVHKQNKIQYVESLIKQLSFPKEPTYIELLIITYIGGVNKVKREVFAFTPTNVKMKVFYQLTKRPSETFFLGDVLLHCCSPINEAHALLARRDYRLTQLNTSSS